MLYCSQKYNIQPTTMHRNQQSIVNNKAPTKKSTTLAKKVFTGCFFLQNIAEEGNADIRQIQIRTIGQYVMPNIHNGILLPSPTSVSSTAR